MENNMNVFDRRRFATGTMAQARTAGLALERAGFTVQEITKDGDGDDPKIDLGNDRIVSVGS